MKAILILLLFSLIFCEIEFKELKIIPRATDINENKKNGDFTLCMICLKYDKCRTFLYDEVLSELTDDYDKQDTAFQVCLSLSGYEDFDNAVYEYLSRNNNPLLNRKILKLKQKELIPKMELENYEEREVVLKFWGAVLKGAWRAAKELAKICAEGAIYDKAKEKWNEWFGDEDSKK